MTTGGGSDANVFNAAGLPCLNVANGTAPTTSPTSASRSRRSRRALDVALDAGANVQRLALRRGTVVVGRGGGGRLTVEVDGEAAARRSPTRR